MKSQKTKRVFKEISSMSAEEESKEADFEETLMKYSAKRRNSRKKKNKKPERINSFKQNE